MLKVMWFEAAEQDVLPGSRNPELLLIIPVVYSFPFCSEKKLILELGMTYVWRAGEIQWLREMMAEDVSTIEGWNHLETSIYLSFIDVDCLLGPKLDSQLVHQLVFACELGFLTVWPA